MQIKISVSGARILGKESETDGGEDIRKLNVVAKLVIQLGP